MSELVLARRGWPAAVASAPAQRPARSAGHRLEVGWARDEAELRRAQRLRHQVFVGELGAQVAPPRGTPEGLDADLFDPFCEHLLVWARQPDGPGEVVGTYRVLTPDAARRAGGYYGEAEFDLTRLRPLRPRLAELGRCCVHPEHREGATILLLWSALADFMARNGLDTMFGCASVGLRDGGHRAADLWQQHSARHLAPIEWQLLPRLPLPVEQLATGRAAELPALLKGYLRCGARLLGAPAWDPDFGTADLPVMLRLDDLPAHYRRHFQRRHGASARSA
jgi:putative hemolysin